MMIVSRIYVKISFINIIVIYGSVVHKLKFTNFGNCYLETAGSQIHQPTQTSTSQTAPQPVEVPTLRVIVYFPKACFSQGGYCKGMQPAGAYGKGFLHFLGTLGIKDHSEPTTFTRVWEYGGGLLESTYYRLPDCPSLNDEGSRTTTPIKNINLSNDRLEAREQGMIIEVDLKYMKF